MGDSNYLTFNVLSAKAATQINRQITTGHNLPHLFLYRFFLTAFIGETVFLLINPSYNKHMLEIILSATSQPKSPFQKINSNTENGNHRFH